MRTSLTNMLSLSLLTGQGIGNGENVSFYLSMIRHRAVPMAMGRYCRPRHAATVEPGHAGQSFIDWKISEVR